MRWSRRLFRILLLAYPKRMRRQSGVDMWLTFERHLRDARGVGRFAALELWRREVIALWRGGRRARVFAREQRHTHRQSVGGRKKSFMPFGMSLLDFKLGLRMLIKYPGLTVVGGVAIAFAMAVGVGTFEFMSDVAFPTLPLDEGDRIVDVRNWDRNARRSDTRALHDFVTWRAELESIEDLSAYRGFERNLVTGDGRPAPVYGVEISASAFRLARVAPLLGRVLVEADEQIGASSVVVIGYDMWQTRFGGASDVVGQTVRLGNTPTTVAGVMPEGFGFPWAHSLWAPFRVNVVDYERGEGPAIRIIGRLAPGFTFTDARAELTSIGLRTAADFPDTHEHVEPRLMPYGEFAPDGWTEAALYSTHALFFLALMVLACANVALLVFVRTATREREIVVRNALGASRGRIVMQLFAEALVLGGIAAVVGLAAASFGLRWATGVFEAVEEFALPFWVNGRIAPMTVLYAVLFTVFGAIVVGVLPALKATGRHGIHARLQRMAGGGSGMQVGGLWTGVIVTQVALTVAFLPIVIYVGLETAEIRGADVGFPAEEYLSVQLAMDAETPAVAFAEASREEFLARFHASYRELERRIVAEPGIVGVTFANSLPGGSHRRGRIEVDGATVDPHSGGGHHLQTATVDLDFFNALDTPIRLGRGFDAADLESNQGVVIVDESFVREILEDRNPIGRRIRYLDPENRAAPVPAPDREPGPWYEIVGVAGGLAMTIDSDLPGFYHLLAPDEAYPVRMIVHVAGDPEAFAPRLRTVAAAVNPALRLNEVQSVDEATAQALLGYESWFLVVVVAGALGLLLSNAGIYSVMAFTVSRRTREIGVRVALGADRRRIVAAILSRSFVQVVLGVVVGAVFLVAVLVLTDSGFRPSAKGAGLLASYMAAMMGVCLLACIVPTRRALRVDPTEALREG